MHDAEIIAKIRDIIEKLLRKKNIILSRDTVAGDVDGWDSLSHALIILRIEKTFGIKFSDAEIGRVRSVGELVDLVKTTQDG